MSCIIHAVELPLCIFKYCTGTSEGGKDVKFLKYRTSQETAADLRFQIKGIFHFLNIKKALRLLLIIKGGHLQGNSTWRRYLK